MMTYKEYIIEIKILETLLNVINASDEASKVDDFNTAYSELRALNSSVSKDFIERFGKDRK